MLTYRGLNTIGPGGNRIRRSMSLNSEQVGQLMQTDRLILSSLHSDDWGKLHPSMMDTLRRRGDLKEFNVNSEGYIKLKSNGEVYWEPDAPAVAVNVARDQVVAPAPAAAPFYMTPGHGWHVRVRRGKSTATDTVGLISNGEVYQFTSIEGNWAKVSAIEYSRLTRTADFRPFNAASEGYCLLRSSEPNDQGSYNLLERVPAPIDRDRAARDREELLKRQQEEIRKAQVEAERKETSRRQQEEERKAQVEVARIAEEKARTEEAARKDLERLQMEEKQRLEKEAIEREAQSNLLKTANDVNDAFVTGHPVEIPFNLLSLWTSNFDQKLAVGKGGFGTVYKGIINYPLINSGASALPVSNSFPGTGKFVAIKKVNADLLARIATVSPLPSIYDAAAVAVAEDTAKNIKKAIRSEVNVLSAFRSCPNIIRLVGYCIAESIDHMCLVYEFALRGDLMKFLLKKPEELLWQYRLRIAAGIASGLNFLHNNDPKQPAYHRDIKSSNVVLTHDFTPKIIDCGLAKYVPDKALAASGGGAAATGVGNTVFTNMTSDGTRFGTSEYMCGEYLRKSSIAYDALCDIYSFGVVLLELMTGKQQGMDDTFLQDDIDALEVDPKVDGWPVDCLDDFKALAESCVEKRKKRIPSSLAVLRQLNELKTRHDRPTQMEQGLVEQLRAMSAELTSLRGEKEIAVQKSLQVFICSICFDEGIPISEGVSCCKSIGPHTICRTCFSGDVITQSNNMTDFTSNGRRIVCCLCIVEKPKVISAYSTRVVCSQSDDLSVAAYMNAVRAAERCESESKSKAAREALERKVEETRLEGELKLHENNQKERLNAVANLHRHRIVDTILTAKCPHCSLSFIDWSQCFAVKCEIDLGRGETVGCRSYFCGWCMEGFKDGCECHGHVKTCARSLNPGSYFGRSSQSPIVDFNEAQAVIRKQKIEKYLDDSNLTPLERATVITLMQDTDLKPLGIANLV